MLFVPIIFGNHTVTIHEKLNQDKKHQYKLYVQFAKSVCVYNRPFIIDGNFVKSEMFSFWVDATSYEISDFQLKSSFNSNYKLKLKNSVVKVKVNGENLEKSLRFGSINYGNGWYFISVEIPFVGTFQLQIYYNLFLFDEFSICVKEKTKNKVVIYPKSSIFKNLFV